MTDTTYSSLQRKPKFGRIIFYLFLMSAITLGFWQRQNITDWWLLRDYQPPVSVAELATETTMTPQGRKIFYVSKPSIQDKQTFYNSCAENEATVVLGCYKQNNGIYILHVTDERLQGVEQVTSAHEMLHAAYARLSGREQKRVNTMLLQAYNAITEQDIKDKIAEYKKNGADTTNELHSILGTEEATLPPELETYYAQYFTNRSKIVTYANTYKSEFTSRKDKVDDLDKQLEVIASQVDSNNSILDAQQQTIQAESKRLDGVLKTGDIDSYNKGVIAYNASLVPFRKLLNQTKQLITDYKSLLDQRNQIATQAQELNKALDSSVHTTIQDQ